MQYFYDESALRTKEFARVTERAHCSWWQDKNRNIVAGLYILLTQLLPVPALKDKRRQGD